MAGTLLKVPMKQRSAAKSGEEDAGAAPAQHSLLTGPVGFVGAGKVGTALASLLHLRGVDVGAVSGRTLAGSRRMARAARLEPSTASSRSATVAHSSVVFLTVPDDAIGPLCAEIAREGLWRPGQGVVHCSGALPSDVLSQARDMGAFVASFHPLQTFANLDAALAHIPGSTFALEGDAPLVSYLSLLVDLLGGVVLPLTGMEKTLYHAAAVLASNYTVTLAALAANLLAEEGITPDAAVALRYLLPLIKGTVDNLANVGLPNALTGPIARGDAGTVARHMQALEKTDPSLAQVYRDLGLSTLPLAQQKSGLSLHTVELLKAALQRGNTQDTIQ